MTEAYVGPVGEAATVKLHRLPIADGELFVRTGSRSADPHDGGSVPSRRTDELAASNDA